jgi:hypothetical protein
MFLLKEPRVLFLVEVGRGKENQQQQVAALACTVVKSEGGAGGPRFEIVLISRLCGLMLSKFIDRHKFNLFLESYVSLINWYMMASNECLNK